MPVRTIVGRIWDEALWDLIKGVFGGIGKASSERVQEFIKKSPRHDLVFALLTMETQDRANLMDAFREYLREGRENRLVRELGRALPRTPEGKLDEERAQRLLKELNSVPKDELRMFLEFLSHDPIAEWFRYWILGKGKEVAVQANEVLAELVGFGIHFAQNQIPATAREIDHWVANTAAPAVHQFRTNQKWIRRGRRRRHRLEDQRRGQEEQVRQQREQWTRDRVAELYDQFRREWDDERGGRQ